MKLSCRTSRKGREEWGERAQTPQKKRKKKIESEVIHARGSKTFLTVK